MFTLPEREHPLTQLLSGFADVAGPYMQQRKSQQSQQSVFDTLGNLPTNASPIEITKALFSNPKVLPEHRDEAAKLLLNMQTGQARQASANRPGATYANRTAANAGIGPYKHFTKDQIGKYSSYVSRSKEFGIKPESIFEFYDVPDPEESEESDLQMEPSQQAQQEQQRFAPQQRAQQGFAQQPQLSTQQPQVARDQNQQIVKPEIETKAEGATNLKDEEYEKFSKIKPLGYEEFMAIPEDAFIPPYQGRARNNWMEARRKENSGIFKRAVEASRAATEELEQMDMLNKLNESGKLPEGKELILIDPETGDLRDLAKVLVGASPETQRFVKIIAGLIKGAKNTFGARVSNFEVSAFLRQYPSLLNSTEGRRQILQQISLTTELNHLKDNALRVVYDRFKQSGITPEEADKLANSLIIPKAMDLRNDIEQIGKESMKAPGLVFKGLPNPKNFQEGDVLNNKKTGKPSLILKNGKWNKV